KRSPPSSPMPEALIAVLLYAPALPGRLRERDQHADAPHPFGLLRARRERPCASCAAEERDELAALHSITSSATSRRSRGISRSRPLAVLRLMTSSNFVGACTGRSAGLAPRRMRST